MNELITLDNLGKAKIMIYEAKNIDELKKIKDTADALRAYAVQQGYAIEIQNDINEISMRAKRRIGEISLDIPTTAGNQYAKSDVRTKQSLLEDAGITKQRANEYEKIANIPEDKFECILQKAKIESLKITNNMLVNIAKEAERNKNLAAQKEEIKKGLKNPTGKYHLVVFDPPWNYGTGYSTEGRRVANPYPEMSVEEIQAIDLPIEDDCILWFWTTHKFIWNAKEIMANWGFDYKAILVWNKEKMGMGDWFRMQCEFCLLGIKGKPIWDVKNLRDIISEPRREHSRKPEVFYKMIDDNFVGKKLDYFGREKRPGWEIFGNDISKFN